MALLKFPIAWFTLSIVFLAPPTNFWCKQLPQYAYMDDETWKNYSIPSNSTPKQEGLNSGYCLMNDLTGNEMTVPCQNGFSYNKSVFVKTIISEWNLVCGRQRLIDLSQISLMIGILTGNLLFGVLADRHGRKTVLMVCIFLQSLFGILASWIPWYWGFIISRFLLAISNGGTIVTSFVMCMEIVGGKWRTIVPILYQIPFGFGNSIMAGVAYFLRDWRYFHFTLSVLACIYIVYIWCIPESPRWLIAAGRKEEAITILRRAASVNRIDPRIIETSMIEISNSTKSNKEATNSSLAALFSTPKLRKRSIILYTNWGLTGITFYAFSQYIGHVSTNIFLTVSTGGLIAFPGTILCIYLISRYGRKYTISTSYFILAGCCLGILFIPKGKFPYDWPRVGLAALGIVGKSVSVPALYLFTGELYPTILRNAGVGVSVMFSRLGSMIAPLIISLEELSPFLPLLVLAIASIAEAILVLPLPETKGAKLPETIDDLDDPKSEVEEKKGEYRSVSKD
ncbi:unnamed protein product [Acanthoscelides obtectus]|nr:unnamed protein product [Acanthoscelides obtectus]CAK1632308.1 Solute carrier family 22 member 3 [Acanthoscelides obtectus]